jgi:hypothetical protein
LSEEKPSFFDRVAGAFTAASLAFLPGFVIFGSTPVFSGHVHPLSWLDQVSSTVGLCLAIILAAVFVIAYPVERWLAKTRSTLETAAWYALILFGLGVLFWAFAWSIPYPQSTLGAALAIGSLVGAAVAFVARLLYPQFLKIPRTTYFLSIALVITALLGPAIPTVTKNAPVGAGIFPDLATGELARGTWNLNPENGSMGTYFYNPHLPIDQNKKYELSFACITPRKPLAYTALIRNDKNLKQFVKHNFKCFGPKTIHFAVDFGGRNFDPQVMLYPADSSTSGKASDAWAILAPVGAVK